MSKWYLVLSFNIFLGVSITAQNSLWQEFNFDNGDYTLIVQDEYSTRYDDTIKIAAYTNSKDVLRNIQVSLQNLENADIYRYRCFTNSIIYLLKDDSVITTLTYSVNCNSIRSDLNTGYDGYGFKANFSHYLFNYSMVKSDSLYVTASARYDQFVNKSDMLKVLEGLKGEEGYLGFKVESKQDDQTEFQLITFWKVKNRGH